MTNSAPSFVNSKLGKLNLVINANVQLPANFSVREYETGMATVSAEVTFPEKTYTYVYRDNSGNPVRINPEMLKQYKKEILEAAAAQIVSQIQRIPQYAPNAKTDKNGVSYTEEIINRIIDNPNAAPGEIVKADVVLRLYSRSVYPSVTIYRKPQHAWEQVAAGKSELLPGRPRADFDRSRATALANLKQEILTFFS